MNRDGFGNEQQDNVIFITFFCKWCKEYKTQETSLEDSIMGLHCYYCNNYGIIPSNDQGSREWFRDGLDGKYFGGYDQKKLNESYGGAQFRLMAEHGIRRKKTP